MNEPQEMSMKLSNQNLEKHSPQEIFVYHPFPNSGPNSKKSLKKWSKEEDELLVKLASVTRGKKWKWIADHIPGKKDSQCRSRWERIKPGMRQGRWTIEEDSLLKQLYLNLGDKWSEIAKHLNHRTGKQVRDRIKNVLDQRSEGKEFSPEDDEKIYKLFEERGPKWKEIQQEFYPERTADFIKNRFYSHYRKFKQKFSKKSEVNTIKKDTNQNDVSGNSSSCQTRESTRQKFKPKLEKTTKVDEKPKITQENEQPSINAQLKENSLCSKFFYYLDVANQHHSILNNFEYLKLCLMLNGVLFNLNSQEQELSLYCQSILTGAINNIGNLNNFNWFNRK
jgi:hypothetical protein